MSHTASGPRTTRGRDVSRPTTRAVIQHQYGSPDVLEIARVPKPAPGPGEVVLSVKAASVNARDWHIMRGEPRLARLNRATFGRRGPRVATRGTDLAGTVEIVGANVTRWQPGDAVFGEGVATFAEHAVAAVDHIAAIPDGVAFDQAAALPLAATTALVCLNAAHPVPGDSILINGASGGVGTFAIQIAKTKQLRVTAVVSPRNADLAADLGADHVVDYTTTDFTHRKDQYDVVLDLVGNRRLRDLRTLVRPGGALVLSGGGVSGTGRILGPLKLLMWAKLYGRFSALNVLTPLAVPRTDVLEQIAAEVAAGHMVPVIDRRFPLEETASAIRYMETEHARAKVVVSVS